MARTTLFAKGRIGAVVASVLIAHGTWAKPLAEFTPRTVQINGEEVAYRLAKGAGPIVVLEAGYGGKYTLWDKVFPEVAKGGGVFAYSSFGAESGKATAIDADGIRTSEEVARTLHETLHALQLSPPYLLVGASLGGLYMQKFAQLYPKETAGIVLVDNRPPTFLNACRAAGIKICTDVSTAPKPEWPPYLKAILIGVEPSEALAPSPEQLGDIPITMITAMKSDMPDADDFMRMLIKAQTDYTRQLKNGRQVLAKSATHESLIERDAAIVVREIEVMRARLRAKPEVR